MISEEFYIENILEKLGWALEQLEQARKFWPDDVIIDRIDRAIRELKETEESLRDVRSEGKGIISNETCNKL